jgi:hypothetical protein
MADKKQPDFAVQSNYDFDGKQNLAFIDEIMEFKECVLVIFNQDVKEMDQKAFVAIIFLLLQTEFKKYV